MSLNLQTISIIIGILLMLIYVGYFFQYQTRMIKKHKDIAKEERDFVVKGRLSQFFTAEEQEQKQKQFDAVQKLKEQMEQVISAKTEERQTKAKAQIKAFEASDQEGEIIDEGGAIYFSMEGSLKSAMPTSESERTHDLEDLMDAVQALEGFDMDHYAGDEDADMDLSIVSDNKKTKQKTTGMGSMAKTMMFKNISRVINKVVEENNFKELQFVQAEKLHCLVHEKKKRLTQEDILGTLDYMMELGQVKRVIEINPEINLVLFKEEKGKKFTVTTAEKVVLAFAAEEKILTVSRLQEKTLWKAKYTKQVLSSLEKKGILNIKNENLIMKGMITYDERLIIEEIKKVQHKKEKVKQKKRVILLEEKRRRAEDRDEKLRKEREEKEREEQEKLIILKKQKEEEEEKTEAEKEEAERQAENEEQKRLEVIKNMPKPQIKSFSGGDSKSPQPLPLPVVKQIETISDEAKQLALVAQDISGFKPSKVEDNVEASDDIGDLGDFSDMGDVEDLGGLGDLDIGDSDLSAEDMAKYSQMLGEVPGEDGFEGADDGIGVGDDGFGDDGEDLASFFDVGEDDVVSDEESAYQEVIDVIIEIFNTINPQTGGIIRLEKLLKIIKETTQFDGIAKIELIEIMEEMKESQIIYDEIEVGGTSVYVFDDVAFDGDMTFLMKFFIRHDKVNADDLLISSEWDLEHLGRVLKRYQDQNLLKIDEDQNYYLPGLLLEEDL